MSATNNGAAGPNINPGHDENTTLILGIVQGMKDRSMAQLEELSDPTDPDNQQVVTEFGEFTEHLTADILRSSNLITSLNQKAEAASEKRHEMMNVYKRLPTMPRPKPTAVSLRQSMSEAAREETECRNESRAESQRRHLQVTTAFTKLGVIIDKLKDIRKNLNTDPKPAAEQDESATKATPATPKAATRPDEKKDKKDRAAQTHKTRAPRIFVPGEINPPDIEDDDNWDSTTSESEADTEEELQSVALKAGRKQVGPKKRAERANKPEKAARPPRAPGTMGTNVHSTVAGISTSNALAKLERPPEDARRGTEHRPWLALTEWELASLRKRMKKNAIWSPSETMIARELAANQRGFTEFKKAKAEAQANGEPFDDMLYAPSANGSGGQGVPQGALPTDGMNKEEEIPTSNRGMKLNEAKKAKRLAERELQQRDAAAAAEETSAVLKNGLAKGFQGLFASSTAKPKEGAPKEATPKEVKAPKTPARQQQPKRKRDSTADTETQKNDGEGSNAASQQSKRLKTETPVPAPPSSASQGILPKAKPDATTATATDSGQSSVATVTTTTTVPLRSSSPRKSSTPILPPVREKRDLKKENKAHDNLSATAAYTNATASGSRQPSLKPPTPTPPPTASASRRPSSRGNASNNGAATTSSKDRPRRASTVHNTPAPEAPPTRPASRRGKRAVKNPSGTGIEGSAAIKTTRDHAPRKKAAGGKNRKSEGQDADGAPDETDEKEEPIDPDEPVYCYCRDVQFGLMILCDNEVDCEIEWFHLPCVGITSVPPKNTKWYCPDCRVKLKVGENGETSRGKKA